MHGLHLVNFVLCTFVSLQETRPDGALFMCRKQRTKSSLSPTKGTGLPAHSTFPSRYAIVDPALISLFLL